MSYHKKDGKEIFLKTEYFVAYIKVARVVNLKLVFTD